MKKIGFGLLWFVVFFMGTTILGGLIVGMIAGGNDPANAAAAGEAAGRAFGENFGKGIFLMSLVIAVAGSFFGWLPGTKSQTP